MKLLLASSLVLLTALVAVRAGASTADPDLVAALGDADPDIRALAAGLLADEPAPGASEALLERLDDHEESWRVRAAAAASLGRLGGDDPATGSALLEIALDQDDDWRVRAAAVEASRVLDGGRRLTRALRELPGQVRVDNGQSTVSLDDPLGDEGLLDALRDPDPRMRSLARSALELATVLEVPEPLTSGTAALLGEPPCTGEVLSRLLASAAGASGSLTVY